MSTDIPCEYCRGAGPIARVDWTRFKPTDACPSCGAISRPAEPDHLGPLTAVARALERFATVLLLLPEEEREGQLAALERRTALLDPRDRPAPEPEAELPGCRTCGRELRPHKHISGLFVCRSPACGTIQRRNRRGQVEIEPIS